jgi:S-DNA-T family DNA segregation ATPase FtsK/SpoIIIE
MRKPQGDPLWVRLDLTVPRPSGGEQVVRVEASPQAHVGPIVRNVLISVGWSGEQTLSTSSDRLIEWDERFGGGGLQHGQRLRVGAAGVLSTPVLSGIRLAVVNGPDAGLVVPLNRALTIGRDPSCQLVLTDADVSRRHLSVAPSPSGLIVHDLGSRNGTTINDVGIGTSLHVLMEGDLVRVGDSTLQVRAETSRPASLRHLDDGSTLVNPAPREIDPTPQAEVVRIPAAPRGGSLRRHAMAALVPLVTGLVLAGALHSRTYLLFALLSPISMLAASMLERTGDRQSGRHARREYARSLRAAHRDIAAGLTQEAKWRRWQFPDPVALTETGCVPGSRLWERRRADADLLSLRIGCHSAPATLQTQDGTEFASAGELHAVPEVCTLREGPLGIAAPPSIANSLGRWCISQLAVHCSPADVRIVPVLAQPKMWRWMQWLPHVQDELARDHQTRSAVIAEVVRIAEQRRAHLHTGAATWNGTWIVLFLDSADELQVPELEAVLNDGAAIGVTALCLAPDTPSLPAACRAIVRAIGATGSLVATGSHDSVTADHVTRDWAEHLARSLARLRAHEPGDDLPPSCDALALHEAVGLSVEDVLLRWKRTDHSPTALLGVSADGPLAIDLVRDGPHALVAGTTGAGKSELLRAWIASLALLNPPEDVAFVLVDYKGGAAFAECAELPHTTGVVTDLDHHEVRRVLTSLGSELQRREVLFAEARVCEWDSYRGLEPAEPLPRLVVVVDEFAGLAAELPEFVTGLVSLAQRGRSLGIHLILATQRPGGVVSPEIRANTALRIALRTTSAGDSADIIDSASASTISVRTPGRGFLLAGGKRIAFQSAWAGAPARTDEDVVRITPLDAWRTPLAPDTTATNEPPGQTQLATLVDVLRQAALLSERPAVRRPWLPALPNKLALTQVPPASDPRSVAIGLVDHPREQRQSSLTADLRGGSIAFVGSAQSGRSNALRTLALAAASGLSPEDLHMHVIDSGGLSELAALPHVGTALTDREPAAIERFLARLSDQLTAQPTPATVMLLVDDWTRAAGADHLGQLQLTERLLELARSAASSRLVLAVAGDRDLLTPRVAAAFGERFVLPLNQREDYALAGIAPRDVPINPTAGRAVTKNGHAAQIAYAGTRDHVELLSNTTRHARREVNAFGRLVVRPLPQRVRLDELPTRSGVVLGVGGDDAEPIEIDLFAGTRRLLIAGPARSGRSTLLRSIGLQAESHARVVAVASPRSALAACSEQQGWEVLAPSDAKMPMWNDDEQLLLLIDDAERLVDSALGDHLTSLLREGPANVAAIVAGRTDELAITYRGLAAEIRRSRVAVLLQPSNLDGELVGASLPRQRPNPTPGRGVLVADPAWRDPAPIPIQIAAP